MGRAPIAVFTYNRVDRLREMFDSLKKCNHIEEYEIYIFNDAANNLIENDEDRVKEVREYLREIALDNTFKSINIFLAKSHKGLAKSVIEGINVIFEKYDSVIDIEDDLVLARDFLDFIDDGLKYFSDDKNIWSISAFTPPLNSLEQYTKTVFLGERLTSWGFGIWKNRWELIDWEMNYYDEFRNNREVQNQLSEWGYDIPIMLRDQAEHFIDSWAVRAGYTQFKYNMLSVFPKKTKSYNYGIFGTHNYGETVLQQKIELKSQKYDFADAEYKKSISDERKSLYYSEKEYNNTVLYGDVEKYQKYYILMCKLMRSIQNETIFERILKVYAGKKVAIYGAGEMGKILAHEILKRKIVNLIGFIDCRKIEKMGALNVYRPNDNLNNLDVVIVTPIMDFYNIRRQIIRPNIEVVSLWELLKYV